MSKDTKDPLGDRIKMYEGRESDRRALPGLPIVVRADGRSFSRFTKNMKRPFDQDLADIMVDVTKYLVDKTNSSIGYTQSDEINLIIDPFRDSEDENIDSSSSSPVMFDGRFQKLTSVIAGLATSRFVIGAMKLWPELVENIPPVFDCRVFEVPSREEAIASLVFRENDATKNAVSMAARAYFPHYRLQNQSASQMQEMLWQEHKVNFNDFPPRFKRGVYVQKRSFEKVLSDEILMKIPENKRPKGPIIRNSTVVLDLPPLKKLSNPIELVFNGADHVLLTSTNNLTDTQTMSR